MHYIVFFEGVCFLCFLKSSENAHTRFSNVIFHSHGATKYKNIPKCKGQYVEFLESLNKKNKIYIFGMNIFL